MVLHWKFQRKQKKPWRDFRFQAFLDTKYGKPYVKGSSAIYTWKKTFGKRWGLKSYMIYKTYTAVIRSILTYGSLLWWRAINTKSHISMLNKVPRSVQICLGRLITYYQGWIFFFAGLLKLGFYLERNRQRILFWDIMLLQYLQMDQRQRLVLSGCLIHARFFKRKSM